MSAKAFHTERWAGAFLAVCGEDADETFLCLKALVVPVKSVHGIFFGREASVKLENILRESSVTEGNNLLERIPAVEYAIRFICLLVEKHYFKYIDSLLKRIEQRLDEQKGLLAVTLETAAPIESSFTEELAQMIKERTNTAGVKIKTCVKPELLDGCILRTEKFYIDASLKGQIDKMTDDLTAAVHLGGNNV